MKTAENTSKINIVLFQPEIPQNTGNIARTCSATGCALHLIHPLGFSLDEKHLRRAGLDYWDGLEIYEYEDDRQFFESHGATREGFNFHVKSGMFFLSQKGGHSLWETDFPACRDGNGQIWLCFGRESRGLDEDLLRSNLDKCVRIPMIEGRRSLNLSNAVAVTVYEALRQYQLRQYELRQYELRQYELRQCQLLQDLGLKMHGILDEHLDLEHSK